MRKYLNITAVLSGLMLLFLVSEILYTLKNPDRVTYYCFLAVTFENNKGETDKSVNYLERCANWLGKKNARKLAVDNYYTRSDLSLPDNEGLKSDISGYIKGLDYSNLNRAGKYDFGRLFYDLALISVKHNERDTATKFLIAAKNIDPTFSFWQVELANYYAFSGQFEKAISTLVNCMNFDPPEEHCVRYKFYLEIGGQPNEPGFLKNEIDNFFEQQSRWYGG